MDSKIIEKRRGFIINFLYFSIIVGIFYVLVNYAMGYIFPFVFASVLAVALQTPVRFISRKLHVKAHGVVSLILVLMIVSAVVGVLFLAGKKIVEEVSKLVMTVANKYDSLAEFVGDVRAYADTLVAKLPAGAQVKATEALDNLMAKVSTGEGFSIDPSMLSAPLEGAWNVVKVIPSVLVTI